MAFIPLYDKNPTRRRPWLNRALIATNVLAFVATRAELLGWPPTVLAGYGLVPRRLSADWSGEAFTVLTSMFLHADWVHLGVNMLSLHIFGDNLEDTLGRRRYALYYLACGLASGAAQVAADPQSALPVVGASGAIGGVMGGYLLLFPRAPVVSFNPILPLWLLIGAFPAIPAWVIGAEFFVYNLLEAIGGWAEPQQGGVAVFAHLGGFATGLVLIKLLVGQRPVATRRWTGFREPPEPAGANGTARWRRRR